MTNESNDQIVKNEELDKIIKYFLKYVYKEDQQKIKKVFRSLPSGQDQIMHTLRELIVGAYLSARDFQVRYNYKIDERTPDWCILNDESAVIGIVDVTSFHIDKSTENNIKGREANKNYFYWRDKKNKRNVKRLYYRLEEKANAYQSIATLRNIPYVVAVFTEWEASVDADEINSCLLDEETGIFNKYPEMRGVLHFNELNHLHYYFHYEKNPCEGPSITMPIGFFPLQLTRSEEMYFLPDLRIWTNGNCFQEAAKLLNEHKNDWAAVINAALAIEIYLKSFLSTEVKSSLEKNKIYQKASKSKHGHDLVELYRAIQEPYKSLLKNEFANLYPDTNLSTSLEKYKDIFVQARYRFEANSRGNIDNGIVYLANEFKEVVFSVSKYTDPTCPPKSIIRTSKDI